MISSTSIKKTMIGETPEWGTPEFKVWWESQYAPAESHNISMNIEYVTGSHLELNKIFWELEEESFTVGADFTGK